MGDPTTLTRFGLLARTQELTRLIGQVDDMEVNRSGAAVRLFTDYVTGDGALLDSTVRVVSRPVDEQPARVRMTVSLRALAR